MKFYQLLSVGLFMASTTLFAQNFQKGSIVQNDKTILDGRVFIDNENQKILYKKEYKTQTIPFDNVTSVMVNGRSFTKTEIDSKTWLAHNLVEGNSSLFKLSNDVFIISKAGETAKLIDKQDPKLNGVLAVLFGDCTAVREAVLKDDGFNQGSLMAYTTNYNACNKNGFEPTEEEVLSAKRNNSDILTLFVGAGMGFNSLSFFDNSTTENVTSIGLNAGIIASPAFLGSLQGNLYFGLEGSANLSSNIAFTTAPSDIDFSLSVYRAVLDVRYHLNKNGVFQPFVGGGIGFTGNRFKGTYQNLEFNVNGGTGILTPKAGVIYNLKNNKSIGLTVSYIPEYENDISFQDENGTVIPLVINSEYINAGLFFYF